MNGLCIQWGMVSPSSSQTGPFGYILTAQYTQPPIVLARNSYYRHLAEGGITDVTKTGFKIDTQVGSSSKVDFYWLSIGY